MSALLPIALIVSPLSSKLSTVKEPSTSIATVEPVGTIAKPALVSSSPPAPVITPRSAVRLVTSRLEATTVPLVAVKLISPSAVVRDKSFSPDTAIVLLSIKVSSTLTLPNSTASVWPRSWSRSTSTSTVKVTLLPFFSTLTVTSSPPTMFRLSVAKFTVILCSGSLVGAARLLTFSSVAEDALVTVSSTYFLLGIALSTPSINPAYSVAVAVAISKYDPAVLGMPNEIFPAPPSSIGSILLVLSASPTNRFLAIPAPPDRIKAPVEMLVLSVVSVNDIGLSAVVANNCPWPLKTSTVPILMPSLILNAISISLA